MNKKIFLAGGVLMAGVLLGGCILFPQSTATQSGGKVVDVNETLTGTLSEGSGGVFLLKTTNKGIVSLHDGSAKLSGYVGKNVTVTGQYSGTTLYVDKVVVE